MRTKDISEEVDDRSASLKERLALTIILPTFNEQHAVATVIEEIRTAMRHWQGTWELLVVDDASTDLTAVRCKAVGATVITRGRNGGSGASRKTGIRAARGEFVAMLDADGTYVAAHLPALLDLLPAYDQVNGARTTEKGTCRLLRAGTKWSIRKLAELLSGHAIPDLNSGMKVFKRNRMLEYLSIIPDGFSCVSSMTLAMLCDGRAVAFVPVEYRSRIGRSKFRPVRDTCRYLMTVVRIIAIFRPFRILAILCCLVSAILGLIAMVHGWSPVSPVLLGSAGCLLSIALVFSATDAKALRYRSHLRRTESI